MVVALTEPDQRVAQVDERRATVRVYTDRRGPLLELHQDLIEAIAPRPQLRHRRWLGLALSQLGLDGLPLCRGVVRQRDTAGDVTGARLRCDGLILFVLPLRLPRRHRRDGALVGLG